MYKWISKENKSDTSLCQLSSCLLWSLNLPLPFCTHLCVTTLPLCQLDPYLDVPMETGEREKEKVSLQDSSFLSASSPSCLPWMSVTLSRLLAAAMVPPCRSSWITAASLEILISALPGPYFELLLNISNLFHFFVQPYELCSRVSTCFQ